MWKKKLGACMVACALCQGILKFVPLFQCSIPLNVICNPHSTTLLNTHTSVHCQELYYFCSSAVTASPLLARIFTLNCNSLPNDELTAVNSLKYVGGAWGLEWHSAQVLTLFSLRWREAFPQRFSVFIRGKVSITDKVVHLHLPQRLIRQKGPWFQCSNCFVDAHHQRPYCLILNLFPTQPLLRMTQTLAGQLLNWEKGRHHNECIKS